MPELLPSNLATTHGVALAIESLGLPTPKIDALRAISASDRDAFLGLLADGIAGKDVDAKRTTLSQILACVSPESLTVVRNLEIRSADPLLVLASAGIKAPIRTSSALVAASDPANQNHEAAKTFLKSLFEHAIEAAAAAPAAIPSQPSENKPSARPEPKAKAAPANAEKSPHQASASPFESHHAYGSNAALCFNAINGRNNTPGVMVDAAIATGDRAYDWQSAVHIWLDEREVATVLAVFRRWRKGAEFAAHGSQNEKSFAIEFQGAHFFAKVTSRLATPPVRAVKILPHDAHKIAILFLRQLLAAYPGVPADEVLNLARSVHLDDKPLTGT